MLVGAGLPPAPGPPQSPHERERRAQPRPLAEAIARGGQRASTPVDPALVARPGLQLRLAVTALRAGVLRYITQDGTIVEDGRGDAGAR